MENILEIYLELSTHSIMFLLSIMFEGGVSGKGDASDEDDDNEFFDAMEDPTGFITVPADPKYHRLILFFCFSKHAVLQYLTPAMCHVFSHLCSSGDLAAISVG